MRVAVIVLFLSVLTTPSEASTSCMTQTEARQHFGPVHIYWHGRDHCWGATRTRLPHQINRVQRKIERHEVQEKIDQPNWHNSMSEMLPDDQPVQTPWIDRWANIEPSKPPIVQVAPLPIVERKQEPMVSPRSVVAVVLVFLPLVLMIWTIEVLFRSERGHSGRKTRSVG